MTYIIGNINIKQIGQTKLYNEGTIELFEGKTDSEICTFYKTPLPLFDCSLKTDSKALIENLGIWSTKSEMMKSPLKPSEINSIHLIPNPQKIKYLI